MKNIDWENIKPGWHELVIKLNMYGLAEQRIEIIDWIIANIQKSERHCVYAWMHNEICWLFKIKFRYERDYILARLRW